ncbi:MAG: DUF2628 domain-containing protein [Clostridia bacterium]|nr:DUF2628 domain-containing protein [Clostridia bacterium]
MAENKFRYSHDNCPICNQPFSADDDIVVCPLCGTPHHRDCYKQNGACGNAEKHGDDFRWESTEPPVSEIQRNPVFTIPETYKKINNNEISQPFSPLTIGVSIQEPLKNFPPELEVGVSTEDVAVFVQQDSYRYIQKFFNIKNGRKQWNWAAIFFAPYWFFYRKLYKHGVIVMALLLSLSFFSYLPPVQRFAESMVKYREEIVALNNADMTTEEYNHAVAQLTSEAQKAITENKLGVTILLSQSLLSLILVIYMGSNANKWYYKHIVKTIKDIRLKEKDSDTAKSMILKAGGVSYGAAFLSVLAEKAVLVGFELILMIFNH